MNQNIFKKNEHGKKVKRDHKFDANRILSCSVSVLLKTADSLLEPVESLCWALEGTVRIGGIAPDDICRKRATLCGTLVRMALCRTEPGAWTPATDPMGGWMETSDSPDMGCARAANAVSWGSDGCEAERWRMSLHRLPDWSTCVLLWTSLLWGDAPCDCCACCCGGCCGMEAGKGCWGKDCCTRDSWEAVGDPVLECSAG